MVAKVIHLYVVLGWVEVDPLDVIIISIILICHQLDIDLLDPGST